MTTARCACGDSTAIWLQRGAWVCAQCAAPQQGRLGFQDNRPHTLARRSDPETSKAGARDASARLGALQAAALEAVSNHPWSTASELEAAESVLGRSIGRRLGELEAKRRVVRGPARRCRITGRSAATWATSFDA